MPAAAVPHDVKAQVQRSPHGSQWRLAVYAVPTFCVQATIDMMALKACARYFPDEKWDAQFCAGKPCDFVSEATDGAVCPPGRTAVLWCVASIMQSAPAGH